MAFKYTVKDTDTGGLNSIVKKYGFANYKQAGISSVPSGNFDLIRPGDVIDIPNYDPNKISPINETSPVLSSKDGEREFSGYSDKLTEQLGSLTPEEKSTTETTKSEASPFATGAKDETTGKTETTGDPVLDKVNKWQSEQDAKFDAEALIRKNEYTSIFQTSLANIDATTAATITGINVTYDKRIAEQKRINKLNIDRVKAYGLGGGGTYTPISYGDAVSVREIEAADKITSLESERNSLISQAKQAQEQGKIGLMREKMTDLDRVNNQLNENLSRVSQEAEKQYKLLRDYRKEEETKHEELVKKAKERLALLAPKYNDEYGAMTSEEKDAFITKLSNQTGIDYASVYGIMESAASGAEKKALEKDKAKLDLESTKELIAARKATTQKTYADILKQDANKNMEAEVPETFKDKADFEKKRQDFIKKYGVDGQKYWDSVFINPETEEFQYIAGESESDPLGLGI